MTRKNKNRIFKDIYAFVIDLIKERKAIILIFSLFMLVAFLTGIIVGVKTHNSYIVSNNFGVVNISSNAVSASTFFTRLFSMLLVTLLLFGCSYTKWFSPIALILLVYRSYLLGLYACLMIALYGVSGTIVSIIIMLPCQLLVLAVMLMVYVTLAKTWKDNRCYGIYKTQRQKTKILLTGLLLLLGICICEELIIVIFSAKVILVI